ncbi:MAG: GxxExxY protein [Candidatus Cloacimonetes bacterium]|nr:GxxExxY protein [Candidatus Cloacimonadota bacterium]
MKCEYKMENELSANKIVYKDLSYKVVGICFWTHSELGGYLHEKYYQRGVAALLKKEKIAFEKEISFEMVLSGEGIGKSVLDFVIDRKIALELKATPSLHRNDFRQLRNYLRTANLKLGILVNFHGPKLKFHRILNSGYQPN